MKILAFDSSGMVASVAVAEDDNLIGEYTINYKKTHSQTLLPMLDELVKMTELELKSIDALAVASGPGSFTGLRIGSATVKGLGQALGKPVVEISTIEGMAYNLYQSEGLICPLMDARRNQVYTGLYQWHENKFIVVEPQMAVAIDEIIEKINQYNTKVIFVGDGVKVFADTIREKIAVSFSFAPAHVNRQRASALAARAMEYMKEGQFVTAEAHKPDYLRLSQAERERMEKEQECK